MSIIGASAANSIVLPSATRTAATGASQGGDQGASAANSTATDPVVQNFLKYANESPAQRMVDDWLKAHGLTEESLSKLPPEKQAAIRKEMADDIKKETENAALKHGKGAFADIVV